MFAVETCELYGRQWVMRDDELAQWYCSKLSFRVIVYFLAGG